MELKEKKQAKSDELTKCRLVALKCYISSDRRGDEVFMKANNKKIWPQRSFEKIRSAEQSILDLDVQPDHEGIVKIELWEKDFFTSDFLGYFRFIPDGSKGEYTTDLRVEGKGEPHRYALTWKV